MEAQALELFMKWWDWLNVDKKIFYIKQKNSTSKNILIFLEVQLPSRPMNVSKTVKIPVMVLYFWFINTLNYIMITPCHTLFTLCICNVLSSLKLLVIFYIMILWFQKIEDKWFFLGNECDTYMYITCTCMCHLCHKFYISSFDCPSWHPASLAWPPIARADISACSA